MTRSIPYILAWTAIGLMLVAVSVHNYLHALDATRTP